MKKSIIALSALMALPVLAAESEYVFDVTTDSVEQPNEYFIEVEPLFPDTGAVNQESDVIASVDDSERLTCAADESVQDLALDKSTKLDCLEQGEKNIQELSYQEILDEGWILADSTVSASDDNGRVEEILVEFKRA
ncbi:hypothetical protein [Vibrio comitans]